ncbi:MAG: tRNA pseudouridine(38-40) synthase TruA [Clostridia bacterium]|nr:tRNA pseudouridine(38-40) synthase TruA [Clostridia bacterium]
MENQKLFCTLSFVGTAYCGYQVQKVGVTVQQKLNEAARAVFGTECDIIGCSRTDSGVHANMFCITVSERGQGYLKTSIPTERIPLALNAHLPRDIAILSASWVPKNFHPRYDVRHKEYRYLIWNSPIRDPFREGLAHSYPHVLDADAIARMNLACEAFLGEHDFAAFMAQGSKVTSTVRCIYGAKVTKNDNLITFTVSANGFLYNMVRIMAGTLIAVAEEKISPSDIPEILKSRDRSLAGSTLPACGLYLNQVVYGF